MNRTLRFFHAAGNVLLDNAVDIFMATIGAETKAAVVRRFSATPKWLIPKLLPARLAADGCLMEGPVPQNAYAKYALPKGLPQEAERVLAIENDPHTVSDFSGEIETGYGRGTKTLLSNETAVVKVGQKQWLAKINYHEHDAARAGLHYDLVVEGLPPNTPKWEINIPRGAYKGRYAYQTTDKGSIILRMKDRGLVLPKPAYTLKTPDYLKTLDDSVIVEQKIDGSLANAVVTDSRVAFRSHRESGETYYDQLPAVEFLWNRSRYWFFRKLFPGPDLSGTVFVGELYHPDGAPRVSGILNSLPVKAREIQAKRGPVDYYVWDIDQYKGRDVSQEPYIRRQALYSQAVGEIRWFNKHWHTVLAVPGSFAEPFYEYITSLGLPFGEGVVVKPADAGRYQKAWPKVKLTGFNYFRLREIQEGSGKYAGSVGRMVVENLDNGALGEVGSLAVTDDIRDWIWQHREDLTGEIVKVRVQEVTQRGAPRAGVFYGFHDSDAGLIMYSESLAGGDAKEAKSILYRLKSAAGWKRA